MKLWRREFAAMALVALVMQACEVPETIELPTVPPEVSNACRGVGILAELAGDPGDPRIAWLMAVRGGDRGEVVWPAGYAARFNPELEILDQNQQVVLREGDRITGACRTQYRDVHLLMPPFS